jgi:hypothetical protein
VQPAGYGLFCASGMSSGCFLGSHARLLASPTAHILSQDSDPIPSTFNNLTHAFSLVDSRFFGKFAFSTTVSQRTHSSNSCPDSPISWETLRGNR